MEPFLGNAEVKGRRNASIISRQRNVCFKNRAVPKFAQFSVRDDRRKKGRKQLTLSLFCAIVKVLEMEKKGSGNCLLSVKNNCDLSCPMRFVGARKGKNSGDFVESERVFLV